MCSMGVVVWVWDVWVWDVWRVGCVACACVREGWSVRRGVYVGKV